MDRMRRLGGPTLLYAVVAVLALASPIAVSEEAPAPADPAATAPASGTVPADSPAALDDSTAAPAAPAAPAQPTPSATPPASTPAPDDPAAASGAADTGAAAQPVLKDDAPADKPKQHVIALAAASSGVTISDFKFSPSGVTINVGDTVTWSNSGPTAHSAKANDGSFDTGILQKGSSGSHTFTQAGTFSYFCQPHPFMKGTITVAAAADTGGDTTSGGDTSSGDTSATGSEADTGSGLPSTGLDIGGIAVLGLMTLLMGAYLRRRTAVEPPRPAGRIGW